MRDLFQKIRSASTRWETDSAYSVRTIDSFLWGIENDRPEVHERKVKGVGTVEFLQLSAAFDIETTSIEIDGKKIAFMYVWQLCINGYVIMGRTWEQFRYTLVRLKSRFNLGEKRKMFLYVHNLAYEFQFMRKWFQWNDVFALKSLTPLSAELTDYGIICRCSYLLTGCSLAMLAGKLNDPEIVKKMGDLQYDLVHTSESLLSDAEKGYCIMDVVIVVLYIAMCIMDEKGVENIPRTKTGYVRRRCRDGVLYHKELTDKKQREKAMFEYRRLMQMLTLKPSEYLLCKRAFAGGFTHANCVHVGQTLEDVTSFDFSSSYPAVMVMDYFPMSRGRLEQFQSEDDFRRKCKLYCLIADITFHNLRPRLDFEFYISKSKCTDFAMKKVKDPRTGKEREKPDAVFDNGRVVSAKRLTTTVTEIDFDIIDKVYEWDSIEIGLCYSYTRGRLPTDFIKIVVDLYNAKNVLKGIEGREKEYMLKKEDLNSTYGMFVTDIVRDEYTYGEDEWNEVIKPDVETKIEEYNKAFSRFTWYVHGLYVTAHARRRLWSGILEAGRDDYIYSDTDSVKMLNADRHRDYIERYNKSVVDDLHKACAYHNIPFSMVSPVTQKGETKILGQWDFDGHYTRFKTLGAKRYMIETDAGKLKMTVSGVNPKRGAAYMQSHYGKKAFKAFDMDLVIPAGETGKLTHSYIDEEIEGDLIDHAGRLGHYHELSYIHLSPCEYSLTISDDFIDFLKGVQTEFEIG